MKKPDYPNQNRGPGGQHPRRGGGGHDRPFRSNAPNRPHGGQKANAEALRLWMAPPAQALTSHLSLMKKRRPEGEQGRKPEGQGGAYDHRNRGKFRPHHENRGEMNGARQQHNHPRFTPKPAAPATAPAVRPAVEIQPAGMEQDTGAVVSTSHIDPFLLFCSYHLGIGPNKEYKPSNINEVARRFNVSPAAIRQAVKDHGMDPTAIMDREFDMALAQLDIQVAPEGIDRTELAKSIYQDFLDAPINKRDWNKILAEDRKENQKVFSDKK